jgi:hypothetical protein
LSSAWRRLCACSVQRGKIALFAFSGFRHALHLDPRPRRAPGFLRHPSRRPGPGWRPLPAGKLPADHRAELDAWRKLSYADLAYEILSKFITDIPAADLKALVAKTYTARFIGTPATVAMPPRSRR